MGQIIGISYRPILGKKRKQPGIKNYTSNTTSSTSHSHNNSNENIDVSSKESLSAVKYSSTNVDV